MQRRYKSATGRVLISESDVTGVLAVVDRSSDDIIPPEKMTLVEGDSLITGATIPSGISSTADL